MFAPRSSVDPRPLGPSMVLSVALALASVLALAAPLHAQDAADAAEAIRSVVWRPIGPANMGGRVSDIDGVPGNPKIFYVSGADGGIFRTRNAGTTFEALFTDQPSYSIGALTVAPSDHNVIWVGTGEGDPRNSTSYGDGVYRSLDGGDTWTHLGLGDTERIKRIAVDPRDPDVAFVCALGHAWGPNEERGVFKTEDGGGTWERVLYIDQDTGCSDLDMDLSNPRIVYAGMWTHRRRPWRFDDGGKETALYRTKDGGATWEKLTNGLPSGPMARIGVAVAQSEPWTVYLITEAKDEGTLFRSDDGGESWRMVNDDPSINFRPFYYSDIRVDPSNPEIIFSLSGGLSKSMDGGRTFQRIGRGVHGDHQSMWIDPEDGDRVLSGSDGGFQVSYDGGDNFDIINTVTLSQFYQIDVDDRDPYWVCGGLQDNGNWCGPSNSLHSAGILKDDWFTYSGGDGFYSQSVPGQPHLVYSNSQGGNIMITDTRTGQTRRIHPYPKIVGSAGDALINHRYRFNWDAPIHVSPHEPGTVYWGGNVLFRSRDFGYSWDVISPDLTTDDPEKQLDSGGEIYNDNTAAEFHTTILTIAESPIEPGVIWVGTDDGNVQLTRDGGESWTLLNDRIRGLPAETWIAKIEASPHDAGTAFIAVDNHRLDDFTPYIFKTTDYGRSWTTLNEGLPQDDYVKVVRQDPRNPNLLYVGMERGLQASWDGGQTWASIRNGLPPVSIRDIKVHGRDNDLIIGSHGRGAFILDDLTPLQELGTAMTDGRRLFPIRRATRWQIARKDASQGQRSYSAPNPPNGALIQYYVSERPDEPLSLSITDATGEAIRTIRMRDVEPGVNRTLWDLRYQGPDPIPGQPAGGRGGGGGRGGRGGGGGPKVQPGTYTATLSGQGWEQSQTFEVRGDPRIDMSEEDFRIQFEALIALRTLSSEMNNTVGAAESVITQLEQLKETLPAGRGSNSDLTEDIDAAIREMTEVRDAQLRRPPPRMGYRQFPRVSEEIRSLNGAIGGVEARPTEPQLLRVDEITQEARAAMDAVQLILDTTIRELNERLGGDPRIRVDLGRNRRRAISQEDQGPGG